MLVSFRLVSVDACCSWMPLGFQVLLLVRRIDHNNNPPPVSLVFPERQQLLCCYRQVY